MPRFFRWPILILILGALASATPLRAGAPPATGPYLPPSDHAWLQIQTAHFTILTDAPEKRALELGMSLERFRATLAAYYPAFHLDSPQPTFIFVFRSGKEYAPYKPRVEGKPVEEVEGTFLGSEDVNYVTLSAAWNRDPRPTIYHEFVHEFLRNSLSVVPTWFNEGFAEYYSTFSGDDRKASIGLPVENHVWWLASHPMIPLRDLFSQEYDAGFFTEIMRDGVFYSESWALVHYLLGSGKSDDRRSRAAAFLDRLQKGEPMEPAFAAAFGRGFDAMEKELHDYVAGGRFPVAVITFTDRFKVDTSYRTSPLGRDDALARLGELLLRLGSDRYADAEAHFREALRINRGNGLALMGMGNLLAAQGRPEEALVYFDKAAPFRPDDPMLCLDHARALLRHVPGTASEGTDEAIPSEAALSRARELLGRATRLRPQYAAAYAELGWACAAGNRDPEEGIAALEKARQLVPSRVEVAANLLYLYLRAGQTAKARALYDRVLVPSGNRQAIEWAQRALERQQAASSAGILPPGGADPREGATTSSGGERTTKMLEKAAEEATDPEKKQKLQGIADELKQGSPADAYNAQVKVLNQAVARANLQDYSGAIAIVEKLLPSIRDPELKKQAQQMLIRLRQDEQTYGGHPK